MADTISTVDELDDYVDIMQTAYVFATDANDRPWLIYATEDELWAVSFPIETAEGPNHGPVQVGDLIVRPDELELPLIIHYSPGVARLDASGVDPTMFRRLEVGARP